MLVLTIASHINSKALISRASHVPPEKSMMRNILKNPLTEPQDPQQVTVQVSIAKQFIDDEVPMDSRHHRKFSSTKLKLYEKFKSFQEKRLPHARPLNATYFFQLMDEMKLTQVDTIQQCSYCSDLQHHQTDITPERLAKCFLHDHFRRYQITSYLLDKKQLNEGIFGFRIFGESYFGALLVIDYGVIKPSCSRHEDLVIHVYTESRHGTRVTFSYSSISSITRKEFHSIRTPNNNRRK